MPLPYRYRRVPQAPVTIPVPGQPKEGTVMMPLTNTIPQLDVSGMTADELRSEVRSLRDANQALREAYEGARNDARRQARGDRELEAFKEQVRDVAIREAEDRGWCEVIDQILEELGLRPRTHTFTVRLTVNAKQEVEIQVEAANEDEASDKAIEDTSGEIADNIDPHSWEWEPDDVEVTEVELSD